MWRSNISWSSSADTSLPDGLHRHEPGPYFKTPSIQSAGSSQSGGGAAGGERPASPPAGQSAEETRPPQPPPPATEPAPPSLPAQRRARFATTTSSGDSGGGERRAAAQQQPNRTAAAAPHGFRSRLSSISGALQHPKLARRLFSGAHNEDQQQHQVPVQITTTSIDSPSQQNQLAEDAPLELSPASGGAGSGRPTGSATSSGGRRLSQLFLPQIGPNQILLNQMADPYTSNELIPPHLLGLFGQPPLVAGAACAGGAACAAGGGGATCLIGPSGHRASWADASLFGRLSNVRPSVDSAFASGQMRHSFDARK